MTTSPSWFDQEKFSRLVKKGGAKPSPAQVAHEAASRVAVPAPVQKPAPVASPAPKPEEPEMEEMPASAPTARISLASKPSPGADEPRALPTLPKRTAPLPALKPIFEYELPGSNASAPVKAPVPPPLPKVSAEVRPVRAIPVVTIGSEINNEVEPPKTNQSAQDLAEAWEKVTSLNEELFRVAQERDQVRSEAAVLRQQLRQTEEAVSDRESMATQIEELSRAAQERDEVKIEAIVLRDQLRQAEQANKSRVSLGVSSEELNRVMEERDNARKEYAGLREQYETLKQEQGHSQNLGPDTAALEQEIETLRQQLAEREQQVSGVRDSTYGMGEVIETLKQELSAMQEQVAEAKDEASVAQRGLALSQKALQETREALREASEGSSMTKGNLDNLKKECSTLVQQNMLLQAQHDQLSRELSAVKAKLAARGG